MSSPHAGCTSPSVARHHSFGSSAAINGIGRTRHSEGRDGARATSQHAARSPHPLRTSRCANRSVVIGGEMAMTRPARPSRTRGGTGGPGKKHAPAQNAPADATLNLTTIYRDHGQFIWLSLQRFGVRLPDLDDLAHDVFMVVHRKLSRFDPRWPIRPWLFGICMRTAATLIDGGDVGKSRCRRAGVTTTGRRNSRSRTICSSREKTARRGASPRHLGGWQAGDLRHVRASRAALHGDRRSHERARRNGVFTAARHAAPIEEALARRSRSKRSPIRK